MRAIAESEIQIVVSARLLKELREVLARPKFASDFTVEQAQALFQGLADCVELVTDPEHTRPRREIPRTTISTRWHARRRSTPWSPVTATCSTRH